MDTLPPQPTPGEPDESELRARKRRLSLGIGIPSAAAALVAGSLGVPWWLVVAAVAVIVAWIFFEI